MDKATADVIMPVYNCEAYVSEALRSIMNQNYSIAQIIVLDDASTDRTPAIVSEIAARDDRIK